MYFVTINEMTTSIESTPHISEQDEIPQQDKRLLRFDPKFRWFSYALAESQLRREATPSPDQRIMKILELNWQDPIKIGLEGLFE
jgi:hypothetical protein